MAIILNIDTATEFASVCLSNDNNIVALITNAEQQNHASFLQPAIQQIITQSKINLQDIDAVAVSIGPGSYTGLRVGLASAKGLCYALQKPLIVVNTLQVMSEAALQYLHKTKTDKKEFLLCPMIDARRKEVFTALYTIDLQIVLNPCALIIDEHAFQEYLSNHCIYFFGSGSIKSKIDICHTNAIFIDVQHNASHMIPHSMKSFTDKHFANLAYCEPLYIKEFYSVASSKEKK